MSRVHYNAMMVLLSLLLINKTIIFQKELGNVSDVVQVHDLAMVSYFSPFVFVCSHLTNGFLSSRVKFEVQRHSPPSDNHVK